jgi:uncharacterized protein (TIGR02145 family)
VEAITRNIKPKGAILLVIIRKNRPVFFVAELCLAAAAVLLSVSGCSKKPERETVPEPPDTLAEITRQEPMPEKNDTLSETQDTLSVSVAFDTFIDKRNGKTYKTMKIGRQVWMAENMNYQPETGKSWCYNDSDSYCEKYGRLYGWETAKNVCPAGWHAATFEEWEDLVKYAGGWDAAGKKLKAGNGWNDHEGKSGNGTDLYGFSALPGGFRDDLNCILSDGDCFSGAGYTGAWTVGDITIVTVHYNNNSMRSGRARDGSFSVRCVRNK